MTELNSLSLTVRPAGSADIDGIMRLLAQLYELEPEFHFDEERQRQGLSLCLKRPELTHLLVAVKDEEVVGFVNLQHSISTFTGGMSLHIDDYVVEESVRGAGVGSALMEGVKEAARSFSCSRITVNLDQENDPARRFYLGRGFEPINLVRLQQFL